MSCRSSNPKYRLTYFNGKGRAETIRLVFAASGLDYEDKRIERDSWPSMKQNTPWGGLPLLETEGKTIGQSLAIARYVAKEGGLAGKTNLEQALVDSAVDYITEIREKAIEVFLMKDESKKAAAGRTFQEENLPTILRNLDKFLGNKNYFVGDKLTLADLHFYAVAELLVGSSPDVLKGHPKLDQLFQRVGSTPRISEYLKNRPKTLI